ncbi:unnamed protein product [Bursaphelenchus xylophilus]|uniref:(pine wood nematode) hypothetical protein n=1 Tax=Bursaphelenchus xylophilus TaxID=6326 RepID=A0A1I7SAA4_BURXY|nr:unnamed protein product [Bursaphelenchus xylophilus]CAG9084134.1 unnamed protein product [Bursaphelenchus xylophilus]
MSLMFVLLFLCFKIVQADLVLKACCGVENKCQEYQRPEEMFGVSCCGQDPINQFTDICCENVTRHRQQGGGFVDKCCGNQTLNFDQTCCRGIVHNVPNGECCGSQAYPRNSVNVLCCNGTLNTNADPGSSCCGNTPYDGGYRETCCGGQVFQKELFDGCCRIQNSDPVEYRQFNSRTHLCCDHPIERNSNMKCCYLNMGNGTFIPKSYDFSTNCCAYPYKQITPKMGEKCVPDRIQPTRRPDPEV